MLVHVSMTVASVKDVAHLFECTVQISSIIGNLWSHGHYCQQTGMLPCHCWHVTTSLNAVSSLTCERPARSYHRPFHSCMCMAILHQLSMFYREAFSKIIEIQVFKVFYDNNGVVSIVKASKYLWWTMREFYGRNRIVWFQSFTSFYVILDRRLLLAHI